MKPATTTSTKFHIVQIVASTQLLCLLGVAALLVGCGSSPESARQNLAKLGKDFTPATFIECDGNGDKEAVRLFLAAGMDVNAPGDGGITALAAAAMKGNTELVRTLLDKGANPNLAATAGAVEGTTPLMVAATGGHAEVVKLLLAKGAEVNAKDAKGLCAVDYAGNNQNVLQPLWERGAPFITTAAMNELFKRFHGELHVKVVQSLLNYESPDACRKLVAEQLANYQDRLKFTTNQLLEARIRIFKTAFRAVEKVGMEESIDASGVAGANPKRRESIKQFVEWLKELQADPVVQREALLTAADDDEPGTVKWLLAQGANANVRSDAGLAPLMFAAAKGHRNVAQVLIDAGADVNMKGYKGWTATMFAASQGRIEVLKMLLAKKPDVNAVNDDGQTALALAQARNQTEAVVALKDAGAKE